MNRFMAFRLFKILCFLSVSACFSQIQDTISIPNNKIKDNIVEDSTPVVKAIVAEIDSTSTRSLKDLELAAYHLKTPQHAQVLLEFLL